MSTASSAPSGSVLGNLYAVGDQLQRHPGRHDVCAVERRLRPVYLHAPLNLGRARVSSISMSSGSVSMYARMLRHGWLQEFPVA
jgi:hypothetical protein